MSRVLVIDDDRWFAEHYEHELLSDGHTVMTAHHALEGIAKVDQQRPDVIVLDVLLPGSNGIALLHELRSHSDLADIPVIVCTTTAIPPGSLTPYGVSEVLDKTTMTNEDLRCAVRKAVS